MGNDGSGPGETGSAGGSGGGSGGGGGVDLDAGRVHEIAQTLGNEGEVLAAGNFKHLGLTAAHFGGSAAGADLGSNYDGAYADSTLQNDDCVRVLDGFRVGLRDAVAGLEETDDLNAVALNQIGVLNPGEAASWRRR